MAIRVVTEENRRKYLAYKNMLGNLNYSIDKKFYLQAIFIEYAMIEDRLGSIIRHLIGEQALYTKRGEPIGLNSKIDKIYRYVHNNTNDYWIKRFLSDELLDAIRVWKDTRNKAVHALLNNYSRQDEVEQIAIAGKALANDVKNVANKVKNHQIKMANKPQKKKPSSKSKNV